MAFLTIIMRHRTLLSVLIKTITFQFAFILLSQVLLPQFAFAQFQPASPPIADPADTRFNGVKEDWTSPSLSHSSLIPASPLIGYRQRLSRLHRRTSCRFSGGSGILSTFT